MTFVKFEVLPAIVAALKHEQDEPCVLVGTSTTADLGPCVVVGAGMRLAGQSSGIALAAHLHPDDAIALAAKLMLAASTILESQGKGGTA